MTVEVSPLYIGVRLRMPPLLLFHKVFHLLQFLFSCAFMNHCFKAIIRAPSTSSNFSVSFYNLVCIASVVFFMSSFLEYFCFYKVFSSFGGTSIVHQWGSSEKTIGSFWDIPKFGVILLGPVKFGS